MKKTIIGAGLILLAVYVLFRDSLVLPDFGMSLWTVLFVLGFGLCAIQNLLRREYTGAYVCGVITWIILENHYHWLGIGTGEMVLAAVLAGLGFGMIVKPRPKIVMDRFTQDNEEEMEDTIEGEFEQTDRESSKWSTKSENDTIFSNTTRYITEDHFTAIGGDVIFSGASLYFSNATMAGNRAIYSGDGVFSTVKLYVPADWSVEFSGDRVFSSVSNPRPTHRSGKTLEITGEYVFSRLEIIYI